MNAQSQEAKELGTVSRPWRRGYSVPNLNANASANSSTMQRPSGEELMNLRLRKVRHDANVFVCVCVVYTILAGVRDQKEKKKNK